MSGKLIKMHKVRRVLYEWAKSKSGYGQAGWMYEKLRVQIFLTD